MFNPCPNVFRSITEHHDDGFHTALAEVIDARFDDGLFAEGKQRLERAHPFRTAGGEDYCCYMTHSVLGLQIAQSTQRVLASHLFAPLVDKVSVIKRPCLHVGSFSRRSDLFVN